MTPNSSDMPHRSLAYMPYAFRFDCQPFERCSCFIKGMRGIYLDFCRRRYIYIGNQRARGGNAPCPVFSQHAAVARVTALATAITQVILISVPSIWEACHHGCR